LRIEIWTMSNTRLDNTNATITTAVKCYKDGVMLESKKKMIRRGIPRYYLPDCMMTHNNT